MRHLTDVVVLPTFKGALLEFAGGDAAKAALRRREIGQI